MLDSAIVDTARAQMAIAFEGRDLTLDKELRALIPSANSSEKAGIELRLICERDMFERGATAWSSLKRAYDTHGGKRYEGLANDLKAALRTIMTDAGVNLAEHLQRYGNELAPAIKGALPIDGAWLRSLRERALDKQSPSVAKYVSSLRRPLLGAGRR